MTRPATRRSPARRAPRLAAAALLVAAALAATPAHAADRWWTYIGGCGAADWLGRVSGTNAQGQTTCWADAFGGTSGRPAPSVLDKAFLVNPGATATLLTTFADASRPAFTARVDKLQMYGNTRFAAGLSMSSQTLVAGSIDLGQQDSAVLGRRDQSGGSVNAASLYVNGGEYRLSGGALNAGLLAVISQLSGGTFTQTGGTVDAQYLYVSSRSERGAEYRLQGGTVNSSDVRMGTFVGITQDSLVTIGGAGSRWVNTGGFVVGASGDGQLVLDGGGSLATSSLLLADSGSATGSFSASAAGTTLAVAGAVTVGLRGTGTASLGAGASLTSGSLDIGSTSGSNGEVTASGAAAGGIPTRWSTSGAVVVGDAGQGMLRIVDGAQFSAGSMVVARSAGSSGQVSVSGTLPGNLRASLSSTGTVVVGDAGQGSLLVSAGGQFGASALVLGNRAGGTGQATVQDAGTALAVSNNVTVGVGGTGTLVVSNGALLRALGDLVIGSTGDGVLQLGSGGLVDAAGVMLGPRGQLVLAGGTLRTADFSQAAGRFSWIAGTLHLTAGAALGTAALPSFTQLGALQTLQVDGTLALGNGTVLRIDGGSLAATTVSLAGGIVTGGSAPLDLSVVGTLSGSGIVAAALAGGSGKRIVASGGALTLGDLNRADGYAYAGTLDAGANQVLLLDRDLAQLGSSTLLAGGVLASVNGIRLGSGQTLLSAGAATVQGRFFNSGAVEAASGVLTFVNDVSGSGSFAGNIVFRAAYGIGGTGSTAAAVTFGGGDVSFGNDALLTIKLGATGADALLDIARLQFDGLLALQFDASAAPTDGTHWKVLDFDSFAGRLDASRVTVSGFDAARLDFSRLAIDGTLAVVAVPEPGTVVLWVAGLVALCRTRRRAAQTAWAG